MKKKWMMALALVLLLCTAACTTNKQAEEPEAPEETEIQGETMTPGETAEDNQSGQLTEETTSEQEQMDETNSAAAQVDLSPYMASEAPQMAYSLEQKGTLSGDAEFTTRYGILAAETDHGMTLYSGDGTEFAGTYYAADPLGQGFFAVSNSETEVNATGLVNLDGTVLLPCDAALIDWMSATTDEADLRYLAVYYAEDITENEDECLIYRSDHLSMGPDEEDVMYTGYGKIYDTKERKFVGDLRLTTENFGKSTACGDSIILNDGTTARLYSADGMLLMEITDYLSVGNGYLIVSKSGSHYVYNDKGEETYIGTGLAVMHSSSGYLKQQTEQGDILLDQRGTQVLSAGAVQIISEQDGMVMARTAAGVTELLRLDGTVLVASSGSINALSQPGFYYAGSSGDYCLVGSTGVLAAGLEYVPNQGCIEENGKLFVIKDLAYSLPAESSGKLGFALSWVRDAKTGLFGVVDLFTGTQLLECTYQDVLAVDGYLYAKTDGGWEVYRVFLQNSSAK